MKKWIHWVWLSAIALILTACGGNADNGSDHTITIGATAGPYSDQLKEGIIPILEEKGFRVDLIEFHDYIQPNNALAEGDIDANLFQNRLYLLNFNEHQGTALNPFFAVPTAPIAMYSNRHTSLEDVDRGMTITLPNDTVNLARSLNMLEGYGWITVDPNVNPITASEKDVIDNPYDLVLKPLEAAATPRSLDDADFAFVNGNYALASGLQLTEAVDVEQTPEDFLIYMTIREGEEEEPFAQALKEAYESEAFYTYTLEQSEGYVLPPYQREREGVTR